MYIPELELQEYPEFVSQELDCSGCRTIECLQEKYEEAVKLNQKQTYTPIFRVYTEELPYDDYTYAKACFYYMRKPNKKELQKVDSCNYRMVENYNKFIQDNPKIAESLDMKIQKHDS